MTILKFHDFSMFSMSVRTLLIYRGPPGREEQPALRGGEDPSSHVGHELDLRSSGGFSALLKGTST